MLRTGATISGNYAKTENPQTQHVHQKFKNQLTQLNIQLLNLITKYLGGKSTSTIVFPRILGMHRQRLNQLKFRIKAQATRSKKIILSI